MRQRVVIAIAMANNPDVIIADEPTTALDVTVQAQVLEALKTAREETGAAMVLITHDLGVIAGQADRVLVMYAGRAGRGGHGRATIFYTPRMPYTLGLLGSLPRLDAGGAGAADADHGVAAVADQPAAGLPVRAALPDGRGHLRRQSSRSLRRPTQPDHVAACHFSDRARRHASPRTCSRRRTKDDALPADIAAAVPLVARMIRHDRCLT